MTSRNYLSISLSAVLISGFSVLHTYAQPKPLDPPKLPKDNLRPIPVPKLHVDLKPIDLGDTLELNINAPVTQAFTLHILTHQDSLLYTVAVQGGTTVLPTYPLGHYHYELLGDSGTVVAKGKFDIRTPKPLDPPKPHKDTLHPLPVPKLHADIKPIELGDTLVLKIDAPVTQAFTLHVLNHQDSLLYTVAVIGGKNSLPTYPVGHYHYEIVGDSNKVVFKGKFDIHAPKPKPFEARILPGGSLKLWIGAPTTQTFTLNILTHRDSLLTSVAVIGGTNLLPALAEGHYHYEIVGDSGIVFKGKFDIHAPKPKPFEASILPGDSLKLWIGAPATQTFTLNILTHGDSLLTSVSVTGGTNLLPALPVGHYHYELVSDSGIVVKKGKFNVRPPKLKSEIAPNPSFSGLGTITLDAPITEVFTLHIFSAATPLKSITINGGTTPLPAIPAGVYHYQVVNSSGQVVSRGRILILD